MVDYPLKAQSKRIHMFSHLLKSYLELLSAMRKLLHMTRSASSLSLLFILAFPAQSLAVEERPSQQNQYIKKGLEDPGSSPQAHLENFLQKFVFEATGYLETDSTPLSTDEQKQLEDLDFTRLERTLALNILASIDQAKVLYPQEGSKVIPLQGLRDASVQIMIDGKKEALRVLRSFLETEDEGLFYRNTSTALSYLNSVASTEMVLRPDEIQTFKTEILEEWFDLSLKSIALYKDTPDLFTQLLKGFLSPLDDSFAADLIAQKLLESVLKPENYFGDVFLKDPEHRELAFYFLTVRTHRLPSLSVIDSVSLSDIYENLVGLKKMQEFSLAWSNFIPNSLANYTSSSETITLKSFLKHLSLVSTEFTSNSNLYLQSQEMVLPTPDDNFETVITQKILTTAYGLRKGLAQLADAISMYFSGNLPRGGQIIYPFVHFGLIIENLFHQSSSVVPDKLIAGLYERILYDFIRLATPIEDIERAPLYSFELFLGRYRDMNIWSKWVSLTAHDIITQDAWPPTLKLLALDYLIEVEPPVPSLRIEDVATLKTMRSRIIQASKARPLMFRGTPYEGKISPFQERPGVTRILGTDEATLIRPEYFELTGQPNACKGFL